MPEIAAEASGIHHRFGAGEPALRGVDLAASRGAVTALIGANGSGKTTLLRILAGILEPTSGTVRILDSPLPAATRSAASKRRRLVGYLSQDPALDPEMTGSEVLNLLAALYGLPRSERKARVHQIAMDFEIGSELDRRVDVLSGGQRQRLHLAAGMLHDPELLCLDEPSTGLDPTGSAFLWAELERRSERGLATIIVTHDLAAVERHAHSVAILERGSVVAVGSPADLIAEHPPSMAEVYSQLTGREASRLEPRFASRNAGVGRRGAGRRGR